MWHTQYGVEKTWHYMYIYPQGFLPRKCPAVWYNVQSACKALVWPARPLSPLQIIILRFPQHSL